MSTFNVVRYSLLGAGVVYGFVHRHNLELSHEEQQKLAQWKKEEKLIKQAKAEYAKLNPPQAKAANASTSINFEDPNLDFGLVLESWVQNLQ
ncbi:hypothetical protein METBIDRAFT_35562 [Metschnikowia bicuspidata var. bicuspidata NRRL YB-4993]|uniref:ATP synthase F(0) complex subunit e, mitochondrial n=1 Tax=Metschnikowia bicuspidata var. bicuspidata NRRL YB-4993 TaxID=869754 RepID=A0A1A0HHB2_9ASCO|nr:hypothetical protein METBIDRAFT_35562 [Metschnikowia bicuspidata var. bicuspidata NRRL YB-4993]OBA23228.1 hypothetical protein METBIDRAFT_35562 [Metschnikowia bicuspidata var. bicuspidata NRRL YB-4993]